MLRILPISIILILTGIIVGLNMQTTPDARTRPTSDMQASSPLPSDALEKKLSQLQTRMNQLETTLNTEIESRKKTSVQLNELKLAMIGTSISNIKTSKENEISNEDSENKTQLAATDVTKPRLTETQRNKNILVAMGVDSNNASRIQRLAEKKELDQLYLRNTASREGWFGTEKYFEKTRELDLKSNIYRDELGDDKYDQFLYKAQMTNRITIQSVLAESPAELTGLQSGDFILSYDNKRVFNWTDLTALTANGEAGESVPIEVKRNNQTFQYFIARGPLGIRLNSERVDPASP